MPKVEWGLELSLEVDGDQVNESSWTRVEGRFPALENRYTCPAGEALVTCWGGQRGYITRVGVANTSSAAHQFVLRVQSTAWGENSAWVRPGEWAGDGLQCGWNECADKLTMMAVGADAYSLVESGMAPSPNSMVLVFDVGAGESKSGFLVRPYEAFRRDLPRLRKHDGDGELVQARAEWQRLFDSASQFAVPDEGAHRAYQACLADCFIMREPIADGSIASVPGTEVYRAANTGEAAVVAIALAQARHDHLYGRQAASLDPRGGRPLPARLAGSGGLAVAGSAYRPGRSAQLAWKRRRGWGGERGDALRVGNVLPAVRCGHRHGGG